ncbi:MAG: nucleotidyltransferase domain-containing protein [Magnetococcales bacterium]|nr:nucleotidyltransferase domain-containing protein [Magnetococcales bacterium]
MRLSPTERELLRQLGRQHFGEGSRLLLFGSRTDDTKKGGDIDLYVANGPSAPAARVAAKIEFLVAVKLCLGEQRVDVVFSPVPGEPRLPIHQMAEETGVPL